ncbi:MAG TPA: dipeptidase [Gemmatimonadales bacterium]|nr:dipeptidase [Gemmatimonadales bacterium]
MSLFRTIALSFVLVITPTVMLAQGGSEAERVKRLLSETPLIDGHNDLPWAIRQEARSDVRAYDLTGTTPGHTDIARLREGMVGGQFWSVYIPSSSVQEGAARMQLEQIDIAHQVIRDYPDVFELALTASDMEGAFGRGRIASMLGMEGGHAIENSLGALRAYYDMGVRYMTLTHSATIDWADAATGLPTHGGLSEFGKEVVREMNRLGMLVDLSHTAPSTMSDALNVSTAPVIFSHSSARAITDHPRNVPDSILRRMPANGGVVMVTIVPGFVSKAVSDHSDRTQRERTRLQAQYGADTAAARAALDRWRAQNPQPEATIQDVVAHIEHVKQVAGIDHVGIGADYDGIESTPAGLEDVSTYPVLLQELARRGWSDDDLRKIAGENVLRVLRDAEKAARLLQRERGPSVKTIQELDG